MRGGIVCQGGHDCRVCSSSAAAIGTSISTSSSSSPLRLRAGRHGWARLVSSNAPCHELAVSGSCALPSQDGASRARKPFLSLMPPIPSLPLSHDATRTGGGARRRRHVSCAKSRGAPHWQSLQVLALFALSPCPACTHLSRPPPPPLPAPPPRAVGLLVCAPLPRRVPVPLPRSNSRVNARARNLTPLSAHRRFRFTSLQIHVILMLDAGCWHALCAHLLLHWYT